MADSDKTKMQDAADQPPAGEARRRREPPTIELDASDVTSETAAPEVDETAAAEPAAGREPPQPAPAQERSAGAGRAGVIGALCGGAAAAAVLGAAWIAGWPPAPATPPTQAVSAPAIDTAATDALAARLSALEADVRMARAAAPAADANGGTIKRLDAMDHSLSAQHEAMETQRAQADRLASSMQALQSEIAAIKATPRDNNAAAPDLSPINERIAQVEQTARAALAQADRPAPAATNDDRPLRNAIAAVMLTNAVQHGEPYAALLAAAKKLANNAAMLAPLDRFATSGVPTTDALRTDLLALLPKLAPPAPTTETAAATPSSEAPLLDRLQASAMRLVHIRRAERPEPETGTAARLAAAARRGDLGAARQELTALPAAERTAAQPWLTQLEARDAALRAARTHAAAATAALAPSTP